MTAEIALLNKVAVALAADSAATIVAGDKSEKVFNSEDKLFELSNTQPIAIMIYNATNFLETPLQVIIKRYRSQNKVFKTVDAAAKDFLEYLKAFALSLDASVQSRSFQNLVAYPLRLVDKRLKSILDAWSPLSGNERPDFDATLANVFETFSSVFRSAGTAEFLDANLVEKLTASASDDATADVDHQYSTKASDLMRLFLNSNIASDSSTGFIIAGFAEDELFPSLRSFEVDGMVGGHLRFMNWNSKDIEHDGHRARIVPFAQQAMVDRFISGMDSSSQSAVEKFCRDRLIALHSELIEILDFSEPDHKQQLENIIREAEKEFLNGLSDEGFGQIKSAASKEMEDMVEFMPKMELAQMAESLVELTSIKRRVTRGFETVGGPTDVAVISRAEGLVWIKRKHYFPADLNARFYARVDAAVQEGREHGLSFKAKPTGARRGKSAKGGVRSRSGSKSKG